jgi:hypothetical protein
MAAAAAAAGGKEGFDAVCKMAAWLSRLHTSLEGCGRNYLISHGLFLKWDRIREISIGTLDSCSSVILQFLKFEQQNSDSQKKNKILAMHQG